jgi:hypothetical protein
MSSDSELLKQLVDREAIRECLYRYCRGIDSLDADLVRSAYWPDIEAQQLDFKGDTEGFIAWSFPQIKKMDLMRHQVANITIKLDGEEADVESSFVSYRRFEADGRKRQQLGGGRYIDRFQRRGGEWRIAKRLVISEWSGAFPDVVKA